MRQAIRGVGDRSCLHRGEGVATDPATSEVSLIRGCRIGEVLPWLAPLTPPPPRAHPLRRSSGVSPGWSAMHTPLVITPLKRGKRALWTFRERRRTATGENKQRLPRASQLQASQGTVGARR